MSDIQLWEKIATDQLADFRIFAVRRERKRSPRSGSEHDFFVLDAVNWVNVIAVTPDDELVLVEQYRHGTDTIELEIPGGMIDSTDDSPMAAGQRELREETGYEGESPVIIGDVWPNPAIMSNRCFTLFVHNCRCNHPTCFDHGEDLRTHLTPIADIPSLVISGKIRHSLVLAALYHFDLWRRTAGAPR